MRLPSSVPPTHLSTFSYDKSSITSFSQLHVSKIGVQRTESEYVETEQGTRLLGHLLLWPELRQHPNESSLRSPHIGVRRWWCFGIDSRRNITYSCGIGPAPSSLVQ